MNVFEINCMTNEQGWVDKKKLKSVLKEYNKSMKALDNSILQFEKLSLREIAKDIIYKLKAKC